MTFTEWHKANAKYMEPADMVAWCAEAWIAGFDAGVAMEKENNQTTKENENGK